MLKTNIDWLKGHYEYTGVSFIHMAIQWFKFMWENLSSEELNKLIQTNNMVNDITTAEDDEGNHVAHIRIGYKKRKNVKQVEEFVEITIHATHNAESKDGSDIEINYTSTDGCLSYNADANNERKYICDDLFGGLIAMCTMMLRVKNIQYMHQPTWRTVTLAIQDYFNKKFRPENGFRDISVTQENVTPKRANGEYQIFQFTIKSKRKNIYRRAIKWTKETNTLEWAPARGNYNSNVDMIASMFGESNEVVELIKGFENVANVHILFCGENPSFDQTCKNIGPKLAHLR